ncbi:serine/threonine-protein kinase [Streptomyces sp. NPDC029526]|uniref:serine/threonine-protein kinase n=1 Tax=Streptomyces sp. NPDC029526 TaxID=3155728 RepID=UPI0033E1C20F
MGEVFAGRYELADPIGRGGVGAVWRAWDHRRRRYVAAKVLLQSDAHSLLRFVREQALRIDHPHVLAPTSWAADDDKVLFTMDLVAGGSLVHLVGDYGPLPPHVVCTLLDQLLAGLAAVHAEGVVHRDIKPANVLLEATGTRRPRLRLSDFGIAMRLGEPRLTETNLVVGTPGYLAPEQMMGSEPDFPSDLFAVGLVALYLLEGAKPDTKALVQHFAAHGTPGAPQGIPEPLWQVVATLLQPDPDARFRTATGARKALAAAAELLPEPGPDDEQIEIFDQLGPLPPGFGPDGPQRRASGVRLGGTGGATATTEAHRLSAQGSGAEDADARPGSPAGGRASAASAPSGDERGEAPSPEAADGELNAHDRGVGGRHGDADGDPVGTDPSAPVPVRTPAVPGGVETPPGPAPSEHMAPLEAQPAAPPAAYGHDRAMASPPDDPRRSTATPATPATVGPPTTPPAEAPPAPQHQPQPSMSDTGSFHLPPPDAPPTPSPAPSPPVARQPSPPVPAPQAPPHSSPPSPWPPPGPGPDPGRAYEPQERHQQAEQEALQQAPDAFPRQPLPAPFPGVSPHDPTHPPHTPLQPRPPAYQAPAGRPYADASTAEYTAQAPRVPPFGEAISAPATGSPPAHRRPRRPGPPAKAAVPLLLLALLCYAVGFWALSHL